MSNSRYFEMKSVGEESPVRKPAKTMIGWEEHAIVTGDYGLNSYLRPGDTVGQDVVDYFSSLVPPALMSESLFQVGTPYDSQPDVAGQMSSTFGTFSREGGAWKFCGYCFLGKTDEPVRDPSLLPEEGGSRPEFDYVTSYGQLERVAVDVSAYEDGCLCVTMESFDEDMGERIRFADITMQNGHLPSPTAAINIESHDDAVVEFLEENGFGTPTGEFLRIGERSYPVFRFDEEKLREADPRGFEQYCKNASAKLEKSGTDKESFDEAKRQARERLRERNAEHPGRQQKRTHTHDLEW